MGCAENTQSVFFIENLEEIKVLLSSTFFRVSFRRDLGLLIPPFLHFN